MKFEGTEKIRTGRSAVWQLLADPAAVGQCIPGLKSLEPVVPGKRYRLVVEVDLGFLQPAFELELFLTSATPERQSRLWLRGTCPDSHIGGSSYVVLTDLGDGTTELHWACFIAAAGWITSLGEWMLSNAIRRLSRGFFERLHQRLGDRLPEIVPSLVRHPDVGLRAAM